MAAGPLLGAVGRGGGRLRGRGSGRKVAASGCRSAAWSAFQQADLAGLWGCTAGPKGDAAAAWAGNRTRASRVAGENSTTEPPMHRWPTPPDAAPGALTAIRPALLTAHCSPVARRHLSAPSEQETTVGSGERGRPESQDPGTCRTTGHGALGGSHSARRAPSAPTTAAATLSVLPEGARSRRRLKTLHGSGDPAQPIIHT